MDKCGSTLTLRHKKTTFNLEILKGNILHFDYYPHKTSLKCEETGVQKVNFWPAERRCTKLLFEDLQIIHEKNKAKISLIPYKYIKRVSKTFLSELDVDIEQQDHEGKTLLHLAARVNDSQYLESIMNKFQNINPIDKHGFTPLHEACKFGNYKNAKLLLLYGESVKCDGEKNSLANEMVNTKTKCGNTCLIFLACKWPHNIKFFKLLLRYNPDCTVTNKQGMRALDIAWELDRNSAVIKLINYEE